MWVAGKTDGVRGRSDVTSYLHHHVFHAATEKYFASHKQVKIIQINKNMFGLFCFVFFKMLRLNTHKIISEVIIDISV